jgi:putative transposase
MREVVSEKVKGYEKEYESDLNGEQWAEVAPFVTKAPGGLGSPVEVDLRRILNGIFYLLRTGCQWRMIPRSYGAKNTIYYYFHKWGREGTIEQICRHLHARDRRQRQANETPSSAVLDCQSVKTSEVALQRGFDGGKKGQGTQTPHRGG